MLLTRQVYERRGTGKGLRVLRLAVFMDRNPNRSPIASTPQLLTQTETSPFQWWEARRLPYNAGLIAAGLLAFACYVVVCVTLLPRVFDPSEIDIDPLTTLLQGFASLFMVGVANVSYLKGPISECIIRPSNVKGYRRACYWCGFWFSVLLPFFIPGLLAFQVRFYPEWFNARGIAQ